MKTEIMNIVPAWRSAGDLPFNIPDRGRCISIIISPPSLNPKWRRYGYPTGQTAFLSSLSSVIY
jgi:hypothetical protein